VVRKLTQGDVVTFACGEKYGAQLTKTTEAEYQEIKNTRDTKGHEGDKIIDKSTDFGTIRTEGKKEDRRWGVGDNKVLPLIAFAF